MSATIALSAVTGHNGETGKKGTWMVATLSLNWLVLDHFNKTIASVGKNVISLF